MYIPPALTGCPAGNACTIPVPLGSVDWAWWGDAINTLIEGSFAAGVPSWAKHDASPAGDSIFVPDSSFPTWNSTITAQQALAQCPWL
jgi:hypothetical protein